MLRQILDLMIIPRNKLSSNLVNYAPPSITIIKTPSLNGVFDFALFIDL